MRWQTDRPARLLALLLPLLLVAACSNTPDGSATPVASTAASGVAPSASPDLEPGQPFTPADILDAMRNSPRPDGVPQELQTDAIAAAIAEAIWTIDGEPWDDILVSASCGGDACQVEVGGSRAGAAGDDAWTFQVTPSTSSVTVAETDLRGIPPAAVDELDRLVRSLVDESDLEGMALTSARWEPPPGGDTFAVSYRSGGEEGSCGLDLAIDPRGETITDRRTVGSC